ncbi:hypothetical protein GT045_35990 [Streptomyces sp. SID486]|uniref:hypothetical protein n=1 Tax=Streptomyces sp. SID486 TaxID=2690264 RepID=UPI00136FD9B3|nr:hypothetical protein [Streptomyces sp. SID486]MYY00052.1 hypothetical protein [Streptomyces sp. SID486]
MKIPLITVLLVPLALAVTGCQGGETKGGGPSAARTTCAGVLDAQTESAVRRLADIHGPAKVEYEGDPALTASQLAAQYLTGKADQKDYFFCGAYRGSAEHESVRINFSLTQELPRASTTGSEFKGYRMGKLARVSSRAGYLYFDCSSVKFDRTTQLVRAEIDPITGVTEPSDAAREDNLRVLHGSSRALSRLLECEPGTGITGSFTVPPAT